MWVYTDFVKHNLHQATLRNGSELLVIQPKDLQELSDYFRGGQWVLSLVGDGMSADEARYRAVVERYFP